MPAAPEHAELPAIGLTTMLLAIFVVMTSTAVSYPGPARRFPLLIGGLGIVLTAAQLVRAVRARTRNATSAPPLGPQTVMFGWFLGAIVLVGTTGVLLGSSLFLFGFLRFRERESLAFSAGSAAGVALLLHVVLERGLGMVLYEGVLR